MKLLYSYIKPLWKLVLLAMVLATINQVFSLLDPYIFQKIIDRFVVTSKAGMSPRDFINGAGLLILAAMGVAMVSRIAKAFQDYFVNVITQKLGAKIYQDGLEHSLELPFAVFEDQSSGQTLGVLQKVRSDVEKLVSALINVLFISIVGIIFVMGYAYSVYWLIAPVYFSAVPLLGWLSSVLSKKIKKVQRSIVGETTALAGATTESLRNIELVKSLGLARQETLRLNNTTNKILGLELRKVKYIRSLSFIQGTFVNFLRNSILLLMLYLIFSDKISVGQFFALFIYSFFIFGPLQELGNIINIYRETEISLENFSRILNTPREKKPQNPVKLGKVDTIEFENVTFKYASAVHPSLDNISFRSKAGETIAFVGPSGSGKTTLVKLLVGLYHPVSGEIYYNGNPSKDILLERLREQIGLVTQDTQLFSGTIKENLLFVNPDSTDEEIMDVLKRSACQNLLARAEKGIDTVIGEGGVKVSGGERQRLAIARALLRKPSLLIFDEATSALDSLTEEEINKTIRDVSQNREHITLLIAHRLSTIMHSDKICVLERGKIVESGRHDELLDLKGLYYAMWRQQIGEREVREDYSA